MRDTPNFQGDWFVHAVDIKRPTWDKPEKVAGADSAAAAQAAFLDYVKRESPDTIVTLRDGGRIMDQQNGRAVWNELIERWLPQAERGSAAASPPA